MPGSGRRCAAASVSSRLMGCRNPRAAPPAHPGFRPRPRPSARRDRAGVRRAGRDAGRRGVRQVVRRDAGLRRRRRQNGRKVLERAYGLADLERETRNRPETIFEAGSVAKQFTAAAILLLARDGQALARRPGTQVRAGAAGLWHAHHDPPPADPHQRASRLGQHRGHRRVAAGTASPHPVPRARHRPSAARAQLRAGHPLVLLEHRLQPRCRHRRPRERPDLRGVHAASASSSRSAWNAPRGATTTRASSKDAPSRTEKPATGTTRPCRSRTCTARAAC